jgi:hypothetical protein
MSGGGDFGVTVHSTDLDNLVRALREQADGRELRKELARNMREALKPAAAEAKNAIQGMPSSGAAHGGPGLRQQIAKKIRPEVRLTGRSTGARVKARKLPANIRNFANAPKRTQQATWRTQTFGNGEWREQQGKLDWFDNSMNDKAPEYKQAAVEAMADMAQRIVNRIH